MSRRLREAKVARLGPAGRAFPSLFAYSFGVNDYSFAMPRPMPPPARLGRFRWFVCFLLFLATTINYADRQILSLIKPILDQRMHWSNEDFGLVNSAFQGAYAVSQLAFGWFIDAFGTKLGYAISVGAWSIAAASHGFATNLRGFFLARAGLGAAEGGNFPAAIKSISLWFPQRERAFATTLLNCGSNFGAMLAPIVVPWIALTWGWQATFIAAGGAGMLWLALWLPLYQAPEKSRFLSQGELAHIEDGAGSAPPEQKLPWSRNLDFSGAWYSGSPEKKKRKKKKKKKLNVECQIHVGAVYWTTIGASMAPKFDPRYRRDVGRALSLCGNQSEMDLIAAGKLPPSATPSLTQAREKSAQVCGETVARRRDAHAPTEMA